MLRPRHHHYNAIPVAHWCDGDSCELLLDDHLFKCRLIFIDAPEMPQPFGPQARDFALAMTTNRLSDVQVKGVDRYGRPLVIIEPHLSESVNFNLVFHGLAWAYRLPRNKHTPYSIAERYAKKHKRGLWSNPSPTPPWNWRKQMGRSKIHLRHVGDIS